MATIPNTPLNFRRLQIAHFEAILDQLEKSGGSILSFIYEKVDASGNPAGVGFAPGFLPTQMINKGIVTNDDYRVRFAVVVANIVADMAEGNGERYDFQADLSKRITPEN